MQGDACRGGPVTSSDEPRPPARPRADWLRLDGFSVLAVTLDLQGALSAGYDYLPESGRSTTCRRATTSLRPASKPGA